MDKIIVLGILAVGGLAAASIVILTIVSSAGSGGDAVAESQREGAVRTKAEIEVISVAVQPGGAVVDAWVKNTGVVNIAAIDKSDLFLIQPDSRYDALTYNNDGVTSKTWYGDLKEAGVSWNRGDTVHITRTSWGGG